MLQCKFLFCLFLFSRAIAFARKSIELWEPSDSLRIPFTEWILNEAFYDNQTSSMVGWWWQKEKKFHAFHNQIHSNGISRFVHKSMWIDLWSSEIFFFLISSRDWFFIFYTLEGIQWAFEVMLDYGDFLYCFLMLNKNEVLNVKKMLKEILFYDDWNFNRKISDSKIIF